MGEDTEPSDWVSGVTGRPCNLSLELVGSPHTCRIGGLPGRMNHGPELDKEETPQPQKGWGREHGRETGTQAESRGWGEGGPILGVCVEELNLS